MILILFVHGGGTISFDEDRIHVVEAMAITDDKLLDLLNQSGYHMTDINLEFQIMQELFHHGFECPGQQPAMLQVIRQTKIGWAMKDEYKCGCCSKEFGFITSDYTSDKGSCSWNKVFKVTTHFKCSPFKVSKDGWCWIQEAMEAGCWSWHAMSYKVKCIVTGMKGAECNKGARKGMFACKLM